MPKRTLYSKKINAKLKEIFPDNPKHQKTVAKLFTAYASYVELEQAKQCLLHRYDTTTDDAMRTKISNFIQRHANFPYQGMYKDSWMSLADPRMYTDIASIFKIWNARVGSLDYFLMRCRSAQILFANSGNKEMADVFRSLGLQEEMSWSAPYTDRAQSKRNGKHADSENGAMAGNSGYDRTIPALSSAKLQNVQNHFGPSTPGSQFMSDYSSYGGTIYPNYFDESEPPLPLTHNPFGAATADP